jgi:hypothetical protein
MKKPALACALSLCVMVLFGAGCGSDDDTEACDKAWAKWCACPMVSCDGHPTSCSGPDKEWADCINAAPDACASSCTP